MAAATSLNTYLSRQQQHLQQLPQQQPLLHHELARLACGLLRVWAAIALPCVEGCPDAWLLQLLPALPIAAELALHVLTGPEGCGLACGLSTLPYTTAIADAAVAMKLVEACATQWNRMVLKEAQQAGGVTRAATRAEAPVLSDTVQKALILHCCALVRAWRKGDQQQQQAAAATGTAAPRSSSWAPSEATNLLRQQGFPLPAVQQYAAAVCDTFNVANAIMRHTDFALSAVQAAVANRLRALRQPDWVVRYRGIIPPVATAAAAASSAGPQLDSLLHNNMIKVHVFAVGVVPEQLVFVALEFLAVLGFAPDRTQSAMSIVALVHMLLLQAIVLRQLPDFALERSVREGYARSCLEYIWLGLGKQLLTAAGVTEAELEGDGVEGATADRPDAFVYPTTLMRDGSKVEIPGDAQERLRMVWGHFGNCLFYAVRLYEGAIGGCGMGQREAG